MRICFLVSSFAVLACGTPSSSGAPSSGASSTSAGSAAPSTTAATTEEELFNQWQGAIEQQVESDARSGATRTFTSREDASAFLLTLSPAGFRPRPEFFAPFKLDAGDVESFAKRMAAYAQAHPEALERRMKAFGDRLDPLVKAVTLNIQRQFPQAWVSDPFAALADAKQRSRPTFMVFSAAWLGVSKDLDRTLGDPAVQKALDERFVAVRVDMTDDEAPAVRKASEAFKVSGLPVLLVFDKTGREVARKTELVDAAGVLALLAQAK